MGTLGKHWNLSKETKERQKVAKKNYTPKAAGWNKGKKGLQVAWNKGKKLPYTVWNKGKKMPSGENHHSWIKDRTKIKQYWTERNNPEYKQWRKQVWLRDEFKCRIANPDCSGRIEAHHILGWSEHPELRYQLNNGITLCHFHHPKMREEEKRLIPTFIELVSVSKV